MDMVIPIDPQTVRRLRTERAWSQERLAEAAGLTPRTIQRLERDGKASPETRLALASAFAVDVTVLGAEGAAPEAEGATDGAPPPRSSAWKGLPGHAWAWAIMAVVFVFLDLKPDGSLDWAYYPILGWGIGVFFSARKAFQGR